MKNLIAMLFCTTSLVLILNGMEEISTSQVLVKPAPKQPPVLMIENLTGQKIEGAFQLKDSAEIPLTLDPGQEITLKNVLDTLENLYVTPYGKVKGWLSISVLTAGYIKSTNVASLDEVKRAQKARQSIKIKVKPGGEGKILGGIISAVAPYNYEVQAIALEQENPAQVLVTVFEQFPQVQNALNEARPILPRYFLNLPEAADPRIIEAAYDRLLTQWSPKTKSQSEQEATLAQRVLEFALQAKRKLLGENSNFDALIDKEVGADEEGRETYTISKEKIAATPVDPLLGYEFIDVSKLSEEKREELREMGFVLKGDPGYPK